MALPPKAHDSDSSDSDGEAFSSTASFPGHGDTSSISGEGRYPVALLAPSLAHGSLLLTAPSSSVSMKRETSERISISELRGTSPVAAKAGTKPTAGPKSALSSGTSLTASALYPCEIKGLSCVRCRDTPAFIVTAHQPAQPARKRVTLPPSAQLDLGYERELRHASSSGRGSTPPSEPILQRYLIDLSHVSNIAGKALLGSEVDSSDSSRGDTSLPLPLPLFQWNGASAIATKGSPYVSDEPLPSGCLALGGALNGRSSSRPGGLDSTVAPPWPPGKAAGAAAGAGKRGSSAGPSSADASMQQHKVKPAVRGIGPEAAVAAVQAVRQASAPPPQPPAGAVPAAASAAAIAAKRPAQPGKPGSSAASSSSADPAEPTNDGAIRRKSAPSQSQQPSAVPTTAARVASANGVSNPPTKGTKRSAVSQPPPQTPPSQSRQQPVAANASAGAPAVGNSSPSPTTRSSPVGSGNSSNGFGASGSSGGGGRSSSLAPVPGTRYFGLHNNGREVLFSGSGHSASSAGSGAGGGSSSGGGPLVAALVPGRVARDRDSWASRYAPPAPPVLSSSAAAAMDEKALVKPHAPSQPVFGAPDFDSTLAPTGQGRRRRQAAAQQNGPAASSGSDLSDSGDTASRARDMLPEPLARRRPAQPTASAAPAASAAAAPVAMRNVAAAAAAEGAAGGKRMVRFNSHLSNISAAAAAADALGGGWQHQQPPSQQQQQQQHHFAGFAAYTSETGSYISGSDGRGGDTGGGAGRGRAATRRTRPGSSAAASFAAAAAATLPVPPSPADNSNNNAQPAPTRMLADDDGLGSDFDRHGPAQRDIRTLPRKGRAGARRAASAAAAAANGAPASDTLRQQQLNRLSSFPVLPIAAAVAQPLMPLAAAAMAASYSPALKRRASAAALMAATSVPVPPSPAAPPLPAAVNPSAVGSPPLATPGFWLRAMGADWRDSWMRQLALVGGGAGAGAAADGNDDDDSSGTDGDDAGRREGEVATRLRFERHGAGAAIVALASAFANHDSEEEEDGPLSDGERASPPRPNRSRRLDVQQMEVADDVSNASPDVMSQPAEASPVAPFPPPQRYSGQQQPVSDASDAAQTAAPSASEPQSRWPWSGTAGANAVAAALPAVLPAQLGGNQRRSSGRSGLEATVYVPPAPAAAGVPARRNRIHRTYSSSSTASLTASGPPSRSASLSPRLAVPSQAGSADESFSQQSQAQPPVVSLADSYRSQGSAGSGGAYSPAFAQSSGSSAVAAIGVGASGSVNSNSSSSGQRLGMHTGSFNLHEAVLAAATAEVGFLPPSQVVSRIDPSAAPLPGQQPSISRVPPVRAGGRAGVADEPAYVVAASRQHPRRVSEGPTAALPRLGSATAVAAEMPLQHPAASASAQPVAPAVAAADLRDASVPSFAAPMPLQSTAPATARPIDAPAAAPAALPPPPAPIPAVPAVNAPQPGAGRHSLPPRKKPSAATLVAVPADAAEPSAPSSSSSSAPLPAASPPAEELPRPPPLPPPPPEPPSFAVDSSAAPAAGSSPTSASQLVGSASAAGSLLPQPKAPVTVALQPPVPSSASSAPPPDASDYVSSVTDVRAPPPDSSPSSSFLLTSATPGDLKVSAADATEARPTAVVAIATADAAVVPHHEDEASDAAAEADDAAAELAGASAVAPASQEAASELESIWPYSAPAHNDSNIVEQRELAADEQIALAEPVVERLEEEREVEEREEVTTPPAVDVANVPAIDAGEENAPPPGFAAAEEDRAAAVPAARDTAERQAELPTEAADVQQSVTSEPEDLRPVLQTAFSAPASPRASPSALLPVVAEADNEESSRVSSPASMASAAGTETGETYTAAESPPPVLAVLVDATTVPSSDDIAVNQATPAALAADEEDVTPMQPSQHRVSSPASPPPQPLLPASPLPTSGKGSSYSRLTSPCESPLPAGAPQLLETDDGIVNGAAASAPEVTAEVTSVLDLSPVSEVDATVPAPYSITLLPVAEEEAPAANDPPAPEPAELITQEMATDAIEAPSASTDTHIVADAPADSIIACVPAEDTAIADEQPTPAPPPPTTEANSSHPIEDATTVDAPVSVNAPAADVDDIPLDSDAFAVEAEQPGVTSGAIIVSECPAEVETRLPAEAEPAPVAVDAEDSLPPSNFSRVTSAAANEASEAALPTSTSLLDSLAALEAALLEPIFSPPAAATEAEPESAAGVTEPTTSAAAVDSTDFTTEIASVVAADVAAVTFDAVAESNNFLVEHAGAVIAAVKQENVPVEPAVGFEASISATASAPAQEAADTAPVAAGSTDSSALESHFLEVAPVVPVELVPADDEGVGVVPIVLMMDEAALAADADVSTSAMTHAPLFVEDYFAHSSAAISADDGMHQPVLDEHQQEQCAVIHPESPAAVSPAPMAQHVVSSDTKPAIEFEGEAAESVVPALLAAFPPLPPSQSVDYRDSAATGDTTPQSPSPDGASPDSSAPASPAVALSAPPTPPPSASDDATPRMLSAPVTPRNASTATASALALLSAAGRSAPTTPAPSVPPTPDVSVLDTSAAASTDVSIRRAVARAHAAASLAVVTAAAAAAEGDAGGHPSPINTSRVSTARSGTIASAASEESSFAAANASVLTASFLYQLQAATAAALLSSSSVAADVTSAAAPISSDLDASSPVVEAQGERESTVEENDGEGPALLMPPPASAEVPRPFARGGSPREPDHDGRMGVAPAHELAEPASVASAAALSRSRSGSSATFPHESASTSSPRPLASTAVSRSNSTSPSLSPRFFVLGADISPRRGDGGNGDDTADLSRVSPVDSAGTVPATAAASSAPATPLRGVVTRPLPASSIAQPYATPQRNASADASTLVTQLAYTTSSPLRDPSVAEEAALSMTPARQPSPRLSTSVRRSRSSAMARSSQSTSSAARSVHSTPVRAAASFAADAGAAASVSIGHVTLSPGSASVAAQLMAYAAELEGDEAPLAPYDGVAAIVASVDTSTQPAAAVPLPIVLHPVEAADEEGEDAPSTITPAGDADTDGEGRNIIVEESDDDEDESEEGEAEEGGDDEEEEHQAAMNDDNAEPERGGDDAGYSPLEAGDGATGGTGGSLDRRVLLPNASPALLARNLSFAAVPSIRRASLGTRSAAATKGKQTLTPSSSKADRSPHASMLGLSRADEQLLAAAAASQSMTAASAAALSPSAPAPPPRYAVQSPPSGSPASADAPMHRFRHHQQPQAQSSSSLFSPLVPMHPSDVTTDGVAAASSPREVAPRTPQRSQQYPALAGLYGVQATPMVPQSPFLPSPLAPSSEPAPAVGSSVAAVTAGNNAGGGVAPPAVDATLLSRLEALRRDKYRWETAEDLRHQAWLRAVREHEGQLAQYWRDKAAHPPSASKSAASPGVRLPVPAPPPDFVPSPWPHQIELAQLEAVVRQLQQVPSVIAEGESEGTFLYGHNAMYAHRLQAPPQPQPPPRQQLFSPFDSAAAAFAAAYGGSSQQNSNRVLKRTPMAPSAASVGMHQNRLPFSSPMVAPTSSSTLPHAPAAAAAAAAASAAVEAAYRRRTADLSRLSAEVSAISASPSLLLGHYIGTSSTNSVDSGGGAAGENASTSPPSPDSGDQLPAPKGRQFAQAWHNRQQQASGAARARSGGGDSLSTSASSRSVLAARSMGGDTSFASSSTPLPPSPQAAAAQLTIRRSQQLLLRPGSSPITQPDLSSPAGIGGFTGSAGRGRPLTSASRAAPSSSSAAYAHVRSSGYGAGGGYTPPRPYVNSGARGGIGSSGNAAAQSPGGAPRSSNSNHVHVNSSLYEASTLAVAAGAGSASGSASGPASPRSPSTGRLASSLNRSFGGGGGSVRATSPSGSASTYTDQFALRRGSTAGSIASPLLALAPSPAQGSASNNRRSRSPAFATATALSHASANTSTTAIAPPPPGPPPGGYTFGHSRPDLLAGFPLPSYYSKLKK